MKTSELVSLLQKASDAYYNTGEQILTDSEYDTLREQLEEQDPNHPYLKTIGAPVSGEKSIRLPYLMPSLTKIKPGTGQVENFARGSGTQWVVSEKLDGVSVLLIYKNSKERQMYLRGDGVEGVDVSWIAYHCQGVPRWEKPLVLRGELVVLPSSLPPGTLARSWVNGLIHRKGDITADEVEKLHFVAYQILEPNTMNRSAQLSWLQSNGFKTPWNSVLLELVDSELSDLLLQRRQLCPYAMDGLVVGSDAVPMLPKKGYSLENPKDMRAFKMILEDQQAETTVVAVEWNASAQGYWIPKIQIEAVLIGGSRIEFLTGHNARLIVDQKIGKGARILIRKSGDVIPTLERVLSPCLDPILLPKGVWDGPEATAKHYKVPTEQVESNEDVLQRRLEHFAKTLDIPHLGPGLVKKLYTAGIRTVGSLVNISLHDLEAAVGKGMAAKIHPALSAKLFTATELDLMIASNCMPRGVGEKKLLELSAINPDPRSWKTIDRCPGWTSGALSEFHPYLHTYEVWRFKEIPHIPYPILRSQEKSSSVVAPTKKEVYCMTGFRSAELEDALVKQGHEVIPTLTKKVSILIVASPMMMKEPNEKIKKAMENGVRILTREEVLASSK